MSGSDGERRAWRALAYFWAVVALGTAGTGLALHHLGPPESSLPQSLPAPPEVPPDEAELAPSPPPEAGPESPPELTATPLPPALPPPVPEAPPEAPPPPPLPTATAPEEEATPIPPPDEALLEPSPYGLLPRIGPEGREPRLTYAAAHPAGNQPRIALVIGGLGISPGRSEDAIRRLPPAATLAFTPLAPRPDLLLEQARLRGMEVLIGLPLDSIGDEPSDHLLRASLGWAENQDRLHRALGRFAGYAGAVGGLGSGRGERFAAEAGQMQHLQEELRERGLYYLDPRPAAPNPAAAWGAAVDLLLDEPLTRGEVERRLEMLERMARAQGSAIGLASEPAPLLVDRIAAWAGQLPARGLVLAPVSAVLRPPQAPPPSTATR